MVSELTTPLSADAMIDPTMDPFKRAIGLCEKILEMLRGGVMQPEDSGVDEELADGSDGATSTPDSAGPAKCSPLGFSPNVGDAELGLSSMQPEDSSSEQELAYYRDNAAGSPDAGVPAKCSSQGLSTNVGSVEGGDSSQQSGIVSTFIPGPVGAPPSSTMQQLGILKPGKHTPTTCSTDVLDIDTDAKSAKRDVGTLQAGLASTSAVAIPLAATTPPHHPDQPGLLLARPPPWPVWMVLAPSTTSPTIRYTHVVDHVVNTSDSVQNDRTGWLQHGLVDLTESHVFGFVVVPWDPGDKLIMPWLYSCVCCEVKIFEWIVQRQINGATMVSSVRNALPCSNWVGISSYYKHSHITGPVGGIRCPETFVTCEKILPRPSPDLVEFCDDSSRDLIMLSVSVPWDPGVCIEMSIEELRSGFAKQQSEHSIESFVSEDINDIKSRMANVSVSVAPYLWSMVTWCGAYSGSRVRLSSGENTSSQQQILEAIMVFSVPSAMLFFEWSAVISHVHNHHFLLVYWTQDPSAMLLFDWSAYSWVLGASVVTFTNCCCRPFALLGYTIIYGHSACILQDSFISASLQIVDNLLKLTCVARAQNFMATEIFTKRAVCPIVLYYHVLVVNTGARDGIFSWWQHYTPWLIVDMISEPGVRCEGEYNGEIIGKEIMSNTESMLPDLSADIATTENILPRQSSDFMAFCGDSTGCLVMLSITVLWGPGFCYQLSREVLQTELAQQQTSGEYIICQERNGSHLQRVRCCALHVWALGNTLKEVQRQCQKSVEKFSVGQSRSFGTAPSATWCFWLIPGAAEQRTELQKVKPIGVQITLLLHLLIPLQQKHGGLVLLQRILPTAQCLLHCKSDLVGRMASSPITTPWDPGAQLRQTIPDVVPSQPVLDIWASHQLNVLWLWDPGGLKPTLGLRASRNLRRGECHGLDYQMGRGGLWTSPWAQAYGACSYKDQVPEQREGGTELMDELCFP